MRLNLSIDNGFLVLSDIDAENAEIYRCQHSPSDGEKLAQVLFELLRQGWNGVMAYSESFQDPTGAGWPNDRARDFVKEAVIVAAQADATHIAEMVSASCPVPLPKRAETGNYQFGDDWPGVFIRGDDAAAAASELRRLLGIAPTGIVREFDLLTDLLATLSGSRVDAGQRIIFLREFARCLAPRPELATATAFVKAGAGKAFQLPDGSAVIRAHSDSPEHDILIAAVERFIEAIYPDFAGYLPDAISAMADVAKKSDWSHNQSRVYKDLLETLMTVSR